MRTVDVAKTNFGPHDEGLKHLSVCDRVHVSVRFAVDGVQKSTFAEPFGQREPCLDHKREQMGRVARACQNEAVPFVHPVILFRARQRKDHCASNQRGDAFGVLGIEMRYNMGVSPPSAVKGAD